MIEEDEALVIATTEFEKHRSSASNYHVVIEPFRGDKTKWIIWFEWKSEFPIPGGRSAVLVDRETGEATFVPGE